jgi:replicative DNA helicase
MNPAGHAERALLGAVLTEPSRLPQVADLVDADDFGSQQHRTV